MDRDDMTAQEIQEIFEDQDRIAAILSLELSIEIEIAEADWLASIDFRAFIDGVLRCTGTCAACRTE